jgi:hypothetical protein
MWLFLLGFFLAIGMCRFHYRIAHKLGYATRDAALRRLIVASEEFENPQLFEAREHAKTILRAVK